MLKAIKIRIFPNTEQKIYIAKLLGSCRFVYNNCLAFKIDKYNNDKLNAGLKDLSKHITELKNKEEYVLSSPEFTLGDYPLMDDKSILPLKNYDRKIQERKELLWNIV